MNALVRMGAKIARWRDAAAQIEQGKSSLPLSPVSSWWSSVMEPYAGAWQRNITVDRSSVSAYWAVFACSTLISKDISKLPVRVMQRVSSGVLEETRLRPVLNIPNSFQTHLEFFFTWIMSELIFGNTYVLKRRNEKNFIDALYVLDPQLVTPLVSPDGSIFYKLGADNLSELEESVIVPASEIIHERMYTLHHPLVGVSPIYACGVPAVQGIAIQDNSSKFFQNMSRPSGVLTAPGSISNEVASRLKENWEANFSGSKIGRVAVLGDALKYEPMAVNAHDSQLIEQLRMTGEMICACFHVPGYKIGVGPMPTVNNTAVLNQQYYDQCLQYIIEKMELRLNEGLELTDPYSCEVDLRGLLRMDPTTRYASHQQAIAGAWKTPNEVRLDENLSPVRGGNTVYMQSQNQSLSALDQRDTEAADGKQDVQASAMNGAQVNALQKMLEAVSQGLMPKETAKAAIAAAFPLLEQSEINSMIDPIVEGSTPPPKPVGAAPVEEDAPEEVDQAQLALFELFRKSPESLCYV